MFKFIDFVLNKSILEPELLLTVLMKHNFYTTIDLFYSTLRSILKQFIFYLRM